MNYNKPVIPSETQRSEVESKNMRSLLFSHFGAE